MPGRAQAKQPVGLQEAPRAAQRQVLGCAPTMVELGMEMRANGRLGFPNDLAEQHEQLLLPQWNAGLHLDHLRAAKSVDQRKGHRSRTPQAAMQGASGAGLLLPAQSARLVLDDSSAGPVRAPASAATGPDEDLGEPAGVPIFVMLPLDTVRPLPMQVV